MGFSRQHFVKVRRPLRHAQVSLCVTHCVDCGLQLHVTHMVDRFGQRCRSCFSVYWAGAVQMASHYVGVADGEEP